MDIARVEHITPTEAIVSLVRTAMARVGYVDMTLEHTLQKHVEAGGDPLEPPASMRPMFKESRNERNLAARTAKYAIDAGVMTALARRLDVEGDLVAQALVAGLDALNLSQEDRVKALSAAQETLLGAD